MNITFYLQDDTIMPPTKAHPSDAGYDLHITKLKQYNEWLGTYTYHTGVIVHAENPNMYFTLHERSSLHKHGFSLANSVGIIDNEYRGELLVVLKKNTPKTQPLPLPFRAVQLIPHLLPENKSRVIYSTPPEFHEIQQSTHRGTGGFGSSG